MELWIKLAGPQKSSVQFLGNYNCGNPAGDAKGRAFFLSSTSLNFNVSDKDKNLQTCRHTLSESNVWYHIVGVHNYDNNRMYLYVNGSLKGFRSITGFTNNTVNYRIGYLYNNAFNVRPQ